VGQSTAKKNMWATKALLIPCPPTNLLFSYTHGDVFLNDFVEVVGHADDVTFRDE
jgi:hypothetical protein